MRKFLKILCATLCLVSITGCKMRTQTSKKQKPGYVINEKRNSSGYKYDWIDFIDYTIYGSDGTAYIEVKPKNLKSSDFESDEDFIKIQALIEELNLNYSPTSTSTKSSKLSVSPSTNLSSGDVITLSLKSSVDSSLGIYTEEYEIRVPELEDSKTIDLFANDLVTIYGVEGAVEAHYQVTGSKITYPEELLNNLEYSISLLNVTEIEKDKTVVEVTANLNEDFADENGYTSLAYYLNKLGYNVETTTKQIVIHDIAKQINFNTVKRADVVSALFDAIEAAEISTDGKSNLNQICSVHRLSKDSKDANAYYVVYQDMNSDGDLFYFRRQFRAVDLNDQIIILSMMNSEQTKEEFATTSYENGEIVLNNMIIEQAEESTEEAEDSGESTEAEVTAEATEAEDSASE